MFRSDYTPKSMRPDKDKAAEPTSDHLASFRLFEKGEELFHEGERGGEAYLIKSGRVRITQEKDGTTQDLGIREPNAIIGEISIISDMGRMGTATAEEETVCIALSRAVFRRMLEDLDLETRVVIEFLADYIRSADEGEPADHELARRHHRILEYIVDNPETDSKIARLEPFFALLCRSLIERAGEHAKLTEGG